MAATFALPSRSAAEEPSPAPPGAASPRALLLPVPQRLQLTWPVAPSSFSFRGWEAGSTATGPLAAFEARSVWLLAGPLSVASLSSSLPTAELDCRLTCQPTLLRSLGVEARLQLYSGAVVRDVHTFTRYEAQWGGASSGPARLSTSRGLFRFGVGGALDL